VLQTSNFVYFFSALRRFFNIADGGAEWTWPCLWKRLENVNCLHSVTWNMQIAGKDDALLCNGVFSMLLLSCEIERHLCHKTFKIWVPKWFTLDIVNRMFGTSPSQGLASWTQIYKNDCDIVCLQRLSVDTCVAWWPQQQHHIILVTIRLTDNITLRLRRRIYKITSARI